MEECGVPKKKPPTFSIQIDNLCHTRRLSSLISMQPVHELKRKLECPKKTTFGKQTDFLTLEAFLSVNGN